MINKLHEQKIQYVASRWAIKEAMVKATRNKSLHFPGMYILPSKFLGMYLDKSQGSNNIKMKIDSDKNQKILDQLGVNNIHTSLSHEEDYSIGFAIIENIEV